MPAARVFLSGQRTMKLMRDELYSCIFSREYTAGDGGRVQRVPYFDLLRDIRRRRNEDADVLHQKLDVAKQREAELLGSLEAEQARANTAAETAQAAEAQLNALQQEISGLSSDLNAARMHAGRVSAEAASEQHRQQALLDSTRGLLEIARAAASELRPFKQEFTTAQAAFDVFGAILLISFFLSFSCLALSLSLSQSVPNLLIIRMCIYIKYAPLSEQPGSGSHRTDAKRPVEMHTRSIARGEVAELQKLLRQLCTLRSRALDDYDASLTCAVRCSSWHWPY